MSENEGKKRPNPVTFAIGWAGASFLLFVFGFGAWNLYQCVTLGWTQRQAANLVMMADAQRALANAKDEADGEDAINASQRRAKR